LITDLVLGLVAIAVGFGASLLSERIRDTWVDLLVGPRRTKPTQRAEPGLTIVTIEGGYVTGEGGEVRVQTTP
jgi:hypothetical protein